LVFVAMLACRTHGRQSPSATRKNAGREKDYSEAPPLHEAAGVGELMIFDAAWEERPRGFRWQVFRRVGKRGLVRVEATNGERVRSRALGAVQVDLDATELGKLRDLPEHDRRDAPGL
jgi:hypothetical protein